MQPAEYAEFLAARVAEAAVKAWESRKPGRVGWGLGHAVVAQNRRSVYADGRAQMYGATDRPDFRGIEGPEDQGVEVLFFWDARREADRHGGQRRLPVAGGRGGLDRQRRLLARGPRVAAGAARQGPAGARLDRRGRRPVAPPDVPQAAEERMRTLRGLTRLQELARRIVAAWEEAYEGARQEQHADAALVHKVATIELPVRAVTEAEAAEARTKVETLSKDPQQPPAGGLAPGRRRPLRAAEGRDGRAVRDGAARRSGWATWRSRPTPSSCSPSTGSRSRPAAGRSRRSSSSWPGRARTCRPARAVRGGGYSAIVESNVVGPEGGQVLVDRTVELINSLWPEG